MKGRVFIVGVKQETVGKKAVEDNKPRITVEITG